MNPQQARGSGGKLEKLEGATLPAARWRCVGFPGVSAFRKWHFVYQFATELNCQCARAEVRFAQD